MKNVDYLLEALGETAAYTKEYVEQRIELAKLEAVERGSVIAAETISVLIVASLGGFVFLLANLTLGFYLSAVFESLVIGFLILFVFYSIVTIVVFIFKHKLITNFVLRTLITKLFMQKVDKNVDDVKSKSEQEKEKPLVTVPKTEEEALKEKVFN